MIQLSATTLDILRCPKLSQPLKVLNEEEWTLLSGRLSSLEVETAFGGVVTMEGGAICSDESVESASYAYPISGGLLYLMPTDAIHLTPAPSADEAPTNDGAS
jgi:uncharacterized protein YbaR (Trm112 family)